MSELKHTFTLLLLAIVTNSGTPLPAVLFVSHVYMWEDMAAVIGLDSLHCKP